MGPPPSVGIGADDLAAVATPQGAVGHMADAVPEELHRSVDEQEVGTSGVHADEALGGGREAAAGGGVDSLEIAEAARVRSGERVRVPAQGYRGARRGAVAFPEVTVGRARGDHLADHESVACTVGDAGEPHGLEREVIEHAPKPAAPDDEGPAGGPEAGPPEAVPADARPAREQALAGRSLPGQAAVERAAAV